MKVRNYREFYAAGMKRKNIGKGGTSAIWSWALWLRIMLTIIRLYNRGKRLIRVVGGLIKVTNLPCWGAWLWGHKPSHLRGRSRPFNHVLWSNSTTEILASPSMIVWIPGLQLDLFAKLYGKFFTLRPGQLFFFLRWIMCSLVIDWTKEENLHGKMISVPLPLWLVLSGHVCLCVSVCPRTFLMS